MSMYTEFFIGAADEKKLTKDQLTALVDELREVLCAPWTIFKDIAVNPESLIGTTLSATRCPENVVDRGEFFDDLLKALETISFGEEKIAVHFEGGLDADVEDTEDILEEHEWYNGELCLYVLPEPVPIEFHEDPFDDEDEENTIFERKLQYYFIFGGECTPNELCGLPYEEVLKKHFGETLVTALRVDGY